MFWHYCDSLMLSQTCSESIVDIFKNINWIVQFPFIWPGDPHDPENNNSFDPDMQIDLTQFQPCFDHTYVGMSVAI